MYQVPGLHNINDILALTESLYVMMMRHFRSTTSGDQTTVSQQSLRIALRVSMQQKAAHISHVAQQYHMIHIMTERSPHP